MSTPAERLATILQTAGVGHTTTPTLTAWLLRVSQLPDSPDKCIGLYDTGGFSPNVAWLVDEVTVQAVIRGAPDGYSAGYTKALEVKDALLGISPVTIDSVTTIGITMLADISHLKYDESRRPLFSVNFRVLQEPPTNLLTHRKDLSYTG